MRQGRGEYELGLLWEMAHTLGVGGKDEDEVLDEIATALGVGKPQGPFQAKVQELFAAYLRYLEHEM